MANPLFTTLPAPKVPRNNFSVTHNNKLTLTAQKLVPTWIKEGLPGDINRIFLECMCRAQPLVCPVFQSYTISHHCFWVPMRTLHKHWQDFLYGGKNGDYAGLMPYTSLADLYSYVEGIFAALVDEDDLSGMKSLCLCLKNFDYMGLPFVCASVAGPTEIPEDSDVTETCFYRFVDAWLSNAWNYTLRLNNYDPVDLLPFLAALKVWSEYYRDENLQDDPMDVVTGSDAVIDLSDVVGYVDLNSDADRDWFFTLFQLRPRAWKKDRFTSALPFAQRGPEVLIPISGTVPVTSSINGSAATAADVLFSTFAGETGFRKKGDLNIGLQSIDQEVDFENANLTTTIEQFRDAERLQRWYENNARGGYRSNEAQPAHWGVFTKDATLQRAVFLGGIRQPLVISEVDQNSATTAESPQGNLAGKGTSYNNGKLFKQYADENGFTLVFTSILQNADYFQGLPKVFTRKDRTEYAWPEFANLGEEPVLTRELYAAAPKDEVFGYTPRYSDYKSVPSEVHGDMRSSLQHWAVPRVFASKPVLNEEFIFNEPQKLAFAVESGMVDEFVMVMRFSGKSSRLLPFYGVPTI